MKTYSISELARQCGLSRSTLLYYSRLGLLKPAARTASNYRQYGEAERERLGQICRLRQTGLSLRDIATALDEGPAAAGQALQNRVAQIDWEIRQLENQRLITARLADQPELAEPKQLTSRRQWTAIMRAAGLDNEGMHRWHYGFESADGAAHQHFLELLGIDPGDVERIRAWSRSWIAPELRSSRE